MDLREGEQIVKVFRHHPTPFVYSIIKAIIAIIPIYLVVYLFQGVFSASLYFWIHVFLFLGYGLVLLIIAVSYWLDKLVVTNQRIVYVNWRNLFLRDESEAMLDDIQDIRTRENGFLANLRTFDYGLFELETASSHATITFDQAPDPEGIRRFVYQLRNAVVL